jgi:hypothetical protein
MGMATLSEMITTTYQLGILDSPSVRVSSITTTYQLGILDSPSVRVSSIGKDEVNIVFMRVSKIYSNNVYLTYIT